MKENPPQKSPSSITAILPALFVALGIAAAGYFIGNTLYKPRIALNTASAKGLAEKRVSADRANWKVSYAVAGKTKEEIPALYLEAEEHQKLIVSELKDSGLSDDEIRIGVISHSQREYRDTAQVIVDERQYLSGSITVETDKIAIIDPTRARVNRLITKGVDISDSNPSYHFTKLNEIKPAMLKEASKNARIAAAEFAENAGVTVGKIRSASQGGFTVVDVGEARGDTTRIQKDVRVVTQVEFYLTD